MPLESRALIAAKTETTYGVDAAPTPAADAILTTKPTIELISEDKTRDVVLPYYGSLAMLPVATGIKIGFSTEVRGSGAAVTPPRIGALLRACSLTQIIITTPGSESVSYNPHSAQDGEGVTIYFYHDGVLYKALGCIGNSVKLTCKTNETAKLDFEFTGMFGGVAAFATTVAFPSPTYGDAPTPPILHTGVFSFGGLTSANAVVDAIELSLANTIVKRPDVNAAHGVKRYSCTGRELSGSFDPEVISLATWNPWSGYEGALLGALSLTVGVVAGNRLVVSAPRCQIDAPKLGAREGIQTYAIAYKPRVTLAAGNDEAMLRFN